MRGGWRMVLPAQVVEVESREAADLTCGRNPTRAHCRLLRRTASHLRALREGRNRNKSTHVMRCLTKTKRSSASISASGCRNGELNGLLESAAWTAARPNSSNLITSCRAKRSATVFGTGRRRGARKSWQSVCRDASRVTRNALGGRTRSIKPTTSDDRQRQTEPERGMIRKSALGSSKTPGTRWRVAQLVEQGAVNSQVVRSSRTTPAICDGRGNPQDVEPVAP